MLKTAIVIHALGLGSLAIASCPALFPAFVSVPCAATFLLVSATLLIKFTLSLGSEVSATAPVITHAKNPAPTSELTANTQPSLIASH